MQGSSLDFVCVMGFDLADKGKKLGPGSKERCEAAALLFHDLRAQERSVRTLFAAGMSDPGKYPLQKYTMAEMMAGFIETRHYGVDLRDVEILAEPGSRNVWGSKAEVEKFLEYAGSKSRGRPHTLYIVSHNWHIPRLYWLTRKHRHRVKFHGVREIRPAILAEIYKLPGQIALDLLNRQKSRA